jgi:hypothetical protein
MNATEIIYVCKGYTRLEQIIKENKTLDNIWWNS